MMLLFLAIGPVFADFISTYEYGEQLYQNPRGISCAKCHGEDGGGGKVGDITVANIKNISRDRIAFSLSRGRSVMPVYRLTDEEIEALYIYLNTKK